MINLNDYGFNNFFANQISDTNSIPARILAVHKERYEIICAHGISYARLKQGVYQNSSEAYPTTGDFVLIQYNDKGDSLITHTLERKTFFSRLDPTPGRGEQAVAANFDYVFIMASLNLDLNIKRIERYLTLGWQSGAIPVIILTKTDLSDDFTEQLKAVQNTAIGVDVIAVSSFTGYGLDNLWEYLKPAKTAVFLGSSGVGKSSLVNSLVGKELMSVNDIREDDSRGRHTTTHRQMIMLPNGTLVIDTPGMRELGMWDISSGLGEAFGDVEEFLGKCRFSDCRHETEPGCALKEAIANGELPAERWQSYLNLKREAKITEDKYGFLRDKQNRNKSIAQWSRQNKKSGNIRK